MKLPVYNNDQPGITYYYSPMSIYNLRMVDHAHIYNDRWVKEHLHCHVYNEGWKKRCKQCGFIDCENAAGTSSLHEDLVGSELNIIFDNCSGQNKYNIVLKLVAWIVAMGCFKSVIFFLVVRHTKNLADHLFLLKNKYQKQNLFTFDTSVTVYPTMANDFLDYDKQLDGMYWKLVGNIKHNHIFSCKDNDSLDRQSNLV